MNKLTCILTLKGREDFSRRFFDHIKEINFPYKLLIGDGDPSSSVKTILSDARIDHINYSYLSFNDQCAQDYFYKIEKLIEQADTPYVMLCDNDDFLILNGIQKSIDFLDNNPDYISSGGEILGFNMLIKNNSVRILSEKHIYHTPLNLDNNSPLARVITYFKNYHTPCFYNIYRKEALLTSFKLFRATGINDFILMELFIALSATAQGRHHFSRNFLHYIRQTNSSQTNASIKSFIHRILYNDLAKEITIMIRALSAQILEHEKKPLEEIEADIRSSFLYYLEKNNRQQFPRTTFNAFVSFACRWNYSFRYFFPKYNVFCMALELKLIVRKLIFHGTSSEMIEEFLTEYKSIRNVITSHPRLF